MKTHFANCILLATAVGIYFPASQLTANEQGQPIETTQPLDAAGPEDALERDLEEDTDLAEELTVNRGAVESSEPAGPLVSNETVADVLLEWYGIPSEQIEEVVDEDDNVPTLAEEAAGEEVSEIVADDTQREDAGLGEGYDAWYGDSAVEASREEAAAVDETVEPAEAVELENATDDVDSVIDEANGDETVYIVESEEAEATEASEEVTANEELVDEAEAFEHASEDSDEGDVAWEDVIDALIEDLTTVEETVDPTEAVEVENAIGSASDEAASDEATSDDSAEYVEAEETTDVEVTEDLAIDEALPGADEEVPSNSEEFYEGDAATDALVEDSNWDQDFNEWFDEGEYGADVWLEEEATVDESEDAAEAALVEDHVEAVEPVIEEAVSTETPVVEAAEEPNAQVIGEEIAVDETVEVTEVADDEGSLITTEALEEDRFEPEVTEDVQYIVAGPSSVTEETMEEAVSGDVDDEDLDIDAVDDAVENEATLDIAESLIEEATEEEATQHEADVDETPAADLDHDATVRTMEFPNWKVIVESDQPMDDLQLLNMLQAAVYQLEAELE